MSDKYVSWEDAVRWLRSQPEQKGLVFHCYYDDPIEKAAGRYAESEEWHAILDLFERKLPKCVLDVGAGRGISSYAFTKAGCDVVALEPDPSPLVGAQAIRELFRKTNLPVTIVEEKEDTLPFPSASFDVVYGRAVFHHVKKLAEFCTEAKRVLKPGGIFLMTREHVISRASDIKAFLDSHPLHSLYGGENAYPLDEYLKAIELSGLSIKKVLGPYESPINFAPMTVAELSALLASKYFGWMGKKLSQKMAEINLMQTWFGRKLSLESDDPGRLYTFLAAK